MEPVQLSPEQEALRNRLRERLDDIRARLRSNKDVDPSEIEHLGQDAAKLHASLKRDGIVVRHHKYMVKNRGMDPDHPDFYMHIHPVEDLLSFIEDQSANEDPEDLTLDHEFTFEVYSRRWGHKDTYRLTRTKTGWIVKHMQEVRAGRDGRVGSRPGTGLFRYLDHDSINYPADLPGYLEWLWVCAAEDGLSPSEVQEALQTLADWVSVVEQESPGGIFGRFK